MKKSKLAFIALFLTAGFLTTSCEKGMEDVQPQESTTARVGDNKKKVTDFVKDEKVPTAVYHSTSGGVQPKKKRKKR